MVELNTSSCIHGILAKDSEHLEGLNNNKITPLIVAVNLYPLKLLVNRVKLEDAKKILI